MQLYLSIGIPALLALIGIFFNVTILNRMGSIEKSVGIVDTRVGAVETRVAAHDRRFDDVIASSHKDALEIMRSMTALHERVAVVETKQS